MARLNGGTFKYTRRIKPGDPNEYNAPFKEASAELSWSGSEDEPASATVELMNEVRVAAVDQVNRMLGAKQADIQSAAVESEILPVAVQPEPERPRRGRPPNKVVAPEPVSPTLGTDEEDDLLGDATSPGVEAITTEELLRAITQKNAERLARPEDTTLNGKDGRATQVIKDLVRNYVSLPQTARDIPQELRAKFLSELKEL